MFKATLIGDEICKKKKLILVSLGFATLIIPPLLHLNTVKQKPTGTRFSEIRTEIGGLWAQTCTQHL